MLVNKHGADWLTIKGLLEDEISASLNALEASEERGDVHRGVIALARKLIVAVEPPVSLETEDVNYG